MNKTPGELYRDQIVTKPTVEEQGVGLSIRTRRRALKFVVLAALFFLAIAAVGMYVLNMAATRYADDQGTRNSLNGPRPQVLSEEISLYFRVNSDAIFSETVEIEKNLIVNGEAIFNSGLSTNNQNIDVGTGIITAANIPDVFLQTLTAGTGIGITGDANPLITNTGVTSLNGSSGAVTLTAGSGISISGNTISSTVTSPAAPAASNSFANMAISGQDTLTAASSTDTLTFEAGSGIILTTTSGSKTITIATQGSGTPGQWSSSGADVYYDSGYVGIGTSTPQSTLDVTGSIRFGSITNGILKVDGSGALSAGTVNLASEVTGVLPIANGGTGATSLNDLITLGTMTTGNYVETITGNSQVGVSGSGLESAGITLSINADSIGDAQLEFNTGQELTTTSSPTFNALTVSSITLGGDTITEFIGTGLQLNAGTLETVLGDSVDLTTEVSGVLPVANGGIGTTTLTDLITLGTMTTGNYVATIAGNSQITVTGSGSETAGITLAIAGNSIGNAQLEFDTGQDLTIASSPTFNGLTLTSITVGGDLISDIVGTGLQLNGSVLETMLGTTVDLTSEVINILPIANGGTNSNAMPTAGGVAYGNGSAYAFSATGNGGQVLVSGGTGSPTWVDAASLGTNYWQRNGTSLTPATATDSLILGGGTTTSHYLEVNGRITGKALAVFNETGDQAIFTASSSGTTRFTIGNNGTVSMNAYGSGVLQTDANGVITAVPLDLDEGEGDYTGILPVSNGGTGTDTHTEYGILYGNGTDPVGTTGAGTSGQILLGVTSGAPVFGTMSGDGSITNSGVFTISDGAVDGTDISLGADAEGDIMYYNGTTWVSLPAGSTTQILHSGTNPSWGAVSLTTDVTGTLPITSGGTGASTLNDLIILGTYTTGNYVATITGSSEIGVTGSGSETAGVTLGIVADSIGNSQLTYDTGQNLTTTSSPTFNGLTVSSLTRGVDTITDFTGSGLQLTGGALQTTLGTSIDLATGEVTGILGVTNGGSGTNTAFTQGSILFAGASGVYTQDNASFYFDDTNDRFGIGTNTPTGKLTLTGAITGKALAILNETGDQNIIAASSSGTTRFIVANNGNIGFAGNTSFLNTITSLASTARTYTFPDATGEVCLTTGNCDGSGGAISGTGTTNYITKFTSSSGVSDSSIYDNGRIGIGTTNPTGLLHITGAVAGKALTIFNETGDQNIISASASGTTRFNVTSSGNIGFSGNTAVMNTLTSAATTARTYTFPDATGDVCLSSGNCAGGGGGITGAGTTNFVTKFTSGSSVGDASIFDNGQVGIGTTTPIGLFNVFGRTIGKALTIFNETGDQAIFTASSSGTTRFTIANSGIVTASAYGAGIAQFNASGIVSSSALNLAGGASLITGTLPVGNGGTGAISFTSNGILYGNNTGAIQATSAGSDGQLFLGVTSGAPIFATMSSDATITNTGILTISDNAIDGSDISLTSEAQGNLMYYNGTDWVRLANGTGTQVLHSGTTPSWSAISLTADVSGTLPVGNGGTGATSLNDLITLGTMTTGNYLATLTGNAQVSVTGSGSENAAVSLAIVGDSIGDSQLTFNTGQNLTTASSPTFNGLTLTSLTMAADTIDEFVGTGLQLVSGDLQTTLGTSITLTSEVTGVLPIANGGTNGTATPTNGGVTYGTGTAYAFTSAGTGGQILQSNGGAAPTWVDASTVGVNYWQLNSGALAPITSTNSMVLGGNTTTPFLLEVNGAKTGKALASFNETGNQHVLTASASGTTVFNLDRSGNISLEGYLEDLNGGTLAINDDLQINGNDILDSAAVTRITLGATTSMTNTALTLAGTATLTASSLTTLNCSNCIDFDDMENSLTIDAATDINLNTFAFTIDMDSTGDFAIRDGTTNIASFNDNGSVAFNPTSGQSFSIILGGSGDFLINTNQLYVDTSAGNVGIGTTNPSSFALQVAGSIGPNANDATDLGSDSMRFRDLFLGPATLHIGTSTGDEYSLGYDTANNRLGFNVNGSGDPEIVMNGSGNLGVGTTNPVTKVDVTGAGRFTGTLEVQDTITVGNPSTTNGQLVLRNAQTANTVTVNTGATASSYTLKLPTAQGSTGQCLKLIDGSGTLAYQDCSSTSAINQAMPVGSIIATGRSTAPTGYLIADGSAVSRATYADLFAAIGTTFGAGDGSTTFNVPDLRGRAPVGVDGAANRINVGAQTLGGSGGEERHTLTSNESGLPGHYVYYNDFDNYVSSLNFLTRGAGNNYVVDNVISASQDLSRSAYVSPQNAASSHNVMDPYLVVNWMIRATNTAAGADLAEIYYSQTDDIKPGDIVSVDGTLAAGVKKSTGAYDRDVVGIVSTKPGVVLGDDTNSGHPVEVALAGRVPVKVTSVNGPIKPGDEIVASAIPGVGMKATKPGYIVGKAIESYDSANPNEIGTVMVIVTWSFYEPDVYLTDTGDISVIAEQNLGLTKYLVKKGDEEVERKGLFSELFAGNIKAGLIEASDIQIGGRSVKEFLDQLSGTASGSAALASGSGQLDGTIKEQMVQIQSENLMLKTEVASLSSKFATLETLTASTNGLIEQLLNGPLTASGSSVLGVETDVESLVVGDTLQVLGHTTLSDLGITGNITAGVMSLNGLQGAINTVGEPLRLQNMGVAGIDILDGKITIDTDGNLVSEGEMTVKKLNISESNEDEKSIGDAVFESGETSIDVDTSAITDSSRIFVTPERPASVGAKRIDENTFRIELQSAPSSDLKVNWWIVN